jgi:hypothetical protein
VGALASHRNNMLTCSMSSLKHKCQTKKKTAYPIGLFFSRSASGNCLPVGDNCAMAGVVPERGSEATGEHVRKKADLSLFCATESSL